MLQQVSRNYSTLYGTSAAIQDWKDCSSIRQ